MQNEEENKGENEALQESEQAMPKEAEAQYTCKECGMSFATMQEYAAHMRWKHKKEEEGVGVEAPKPPEVETIEEAIAFIKDRLAQVYGVGKNDRLIIKALEDDPTPLRDGTLLHAFIKSLAPKAYDAHLSTSVIKPLYVRFPNLAQAVDKYLGGVQPIPYYQPYGVTYSPSPAYSYPAYPTYPSTYPPATYPINPTYSSYPATYPHPPYPTKPLKTYKVVVDGQEIVTDEEGFRAWKEYEMKKEKEKREAQEHELRMKKLEQEITERKETTIPVKIGDKEFQVPASLAPLYLKGTDETSKKIDELSRKLEEEREARYKAELEIVKRDLEEVKRRPSLLEELQIYESIAQRLGYQRGGRTTADLLDSLAERIDQRAAQILNKIPTPGGEWKPAVTRTPEERVKKAEEIKQKLERSEEILQAEDELIKAAAKVKPRIGTG